MLNKIALFIFKTLLSRELKTNKNLNEKIAQADKQLEEYQNYILEMELRGAVVPSFAQSYEKSVYTEKQKHYITKRIAENISKGICPNENIILKSYFNNTHPLWEDYLILKQKTNK